MKSIQLHGAVNFYSLVANARVVSATALKQRVSHKNIAWANTVRGRSTSSASLPLNDASPYHHLPGPRNYPIVGSLLELLRLDPALKHEYTRDCFERYGPVFRLKVLKHEVVHVCDPDVIEVLYRADSTGSEYPKRIMIPPWQQWRDEQNLSRGILVENGEKWRRMRSQLDKMLLRPIEVRTFDDKFNEVITDFVARLDQVVNRDPDRRVPELNEELFRWSLETIGSLLYERRFNMFGDDRSEEMQTFINSVKDVFLYLHNLFFIPRSLQTILFPKEKKLHDDGWKFIFEIAQKSVNEAVRVMEEKMKHGEPVTGFLSTLMSKKQLSEAEIHANISELMMAAVDTTSRTTEWMLYILSTRPDVQSKVNEEVNSLVKDGEIPNYTAVSKMRYLKAVIKETLRLYPITTVLTKQLTNDLILSGYNIPKGTWILSDIYTAGRNPSNFSDPDKFDPSRWLREDSNEDKKLKSFAALPFGVGARMCIGRRIAELEMLLLISRISKTYRLESLEKEALKPVFKDLLVPEHTPAIAFIKR